MNVDFLVLGKETLIKNEFDLRRFSVLLTDRDYEISRIVFADNADDVRGAIGECDPDDMIVAAGNTDILYDALFGESEEADRSLDYFRFGEHTFVPMREMSERKVKEVVIPLLNAKNKKYYNTVIFRTFGKTQEELREILSDYLKNRNKIMFEFNREGEQCEVRVRYSRSTSSATVNDVISGVGNALKDNVYALKDISLAESTAELLLASDKKLCIAESFTGGGVASALVAYPGMSKCLLESIVAYSNEAKEKRLGVSHNILETCGAVSADTAFEMASGLLADPMCDIAVATTGNAGPTAERNGQVGLYYVAVGDRNAIHVFEHYYNAENAAGKLDMALRREITESGISTALFELGKYLKELKRRNQ